jgi:hypothetical protein
MLKTVMIVTVMFMMAALCSTSLAAQDTGGASARLILGTGILYLDEPAQFLGGGSIRIPMVKRLGAEPEFVVVPGSRFTQWTLMPNVSLDLRGPGRAVIPYVIGGLGYLHELDKAIEYERSDWAFHGGVGARIVAGKGLFIAPEFRIGHDIRIVVGLGYLFAGT